MIGRRLFRPVGLWALLALLSLAQAQGILAGFSVLWRTAVLSWDSPITQLRDEAASQSVPSAEGAGEGDAYLLLRAPAALLLPDPPASPSRLATALRAPRSPPAS